MLIKIFIQGGVIQDIETSEQATVQIVDLDDDTISKLETDAQVVTLEQE